MRDKTPDLILNREVQSKTTIKWHFIHSPLEKVQNDNTECWEGSKRYLGTARESVKLYNHCKTMLNCLPRLNIHIFHTLAIPFLQKLYTNMHE